VEVLPANRQGRDTMMRILLASVAVLALLNSSTARATLAPPSNDCVICTLMFDPATQQRYWACPGAPTGAITCLIGYGGTSCTNQGFCN